MVLLYSIQLHCLIDFAWTLTATATIHLLPWKQKKPQGCQSFWTGNLRGFD
jgi:hypothetical protein